MEITAEKTTYPFIVFKIQQNFYSINSKNIAGIMQLTHFETIPDAPKSVAGLFTFRDEALAIISLRSIFGKQTLSQEFDTFNKMIEQRKQDHINWVQQLNLSVMNNKEFTLATDPHKCAFGKWYDNFKSDKNNIMYHLRKIDKPHKALHHSALEIEQCNQDHDNCEREECIKEILARTEEQYMKKVVNLLEESKHVFKDDFHEMILVIDNGTSKVGILVDEVICVEELELMTGRNELKSIENLTYVSAVMKSNRLKSLVLNIDEESMFEFIKDLDITPAEQNPETPENSDVKTKAEEEIASQDEQEDTEKTI